MRSTAAAVAVVGAAGASARGSVYERVQKRACALRNKWTIASLRWQKQSAALRHTPKAAEKRAFRHAPFCRPNLLYPNDGGASPARSGECAPTQPRNKQASNIHVK